MIDPQLAYFLIAQRARVRRVLAEMQARIERRQDSLREEQVHVDLYGHFTECWIKGVPTGENVYTHASGAKRDPLDRERGE